MPARSEARGESRAAHVSSLNWRPGPAMCPAAFFPGRRACGW